MKGWIIVHSALSILGFGLIINFIINYNLIYLLLNAFTFLANAIMLFFEIKKYAILGADE